MMLRLAEINEDASRWCYLQAEERRARLTLWYSYYFGALGVAFKNSPGHKMIATVSSLKDINPVAEHLLLFADHLAIRDTRPLLPAGGSMSVAVPTSDEPHPQRPDYSKLNGLKGAPMIPMALPWYWTSSTTTLDDGSHAVYAVSMGEAFVFEEDFYEWFFSENDHLLRSGQVIYAPFIPPADHEAVWASKGAPLPSLYDATPVYSTLADWMDEDQVRTLLRLDIPFLDSVDQETLSKVKADHHDSFTKFRGAILKAVESLKVKAGDEGFDAAVRRIQRDIIDDNVAALKADMNRVTKMRVARGAGWTLASTGTVLGALLAPQISIPAAAIAAVSGPIVSAITEAIARMKEQGALRDNPAYFLWQLRDSK